MPNRNWRGILHHLYPQWMKVLFCSLDLGFQGTEWTASQEPFTQTSPLGPKAPRSLLGDVNRFVSTGVRGRPMVVSLSWSSQVVLQKWALGTGLHGFFFISALDFLRGQYHHRKETSRPCKCYSLHVPLYSFVCFSFSLPH